MPDLDTIDGDIADFIEPQREATGTFAVAELRRYLENEGYLPGFIDEAMKRWQREWIVVEGSTFRLTKAGVAVVDLLA